MKRKYFFAMFIASVFIITMSSCSEDLDYRKACAEKDWPRAYAIVDKLHEHVQECLVEYEDKKFTNSGSETGAKYRNAKENYEKAIKYVVLQESVSVIEDNGTNGLIRIVGIAKEHNAENWLFTELKDVAQKIGDADLEEKINNIINSSSKK